ncbi:hypothetical protein [Variovorax sp. OV084]|uniref:hypothetical protein n=1 Tax=Variovorax sp. OV084 TaxID=1882777 RepID=UPI00115FBF47|nr:hypothetical protein [Variovorax sp. OV084]
MIQLRLRLRATSAALLTAALSLLATPSLAQRSRDVHEHGAARELKASDFSGAPRDLVLWGDLARAGLTRKNGQYKLTFMPAKIRELHGKSVTLVGYMTAISGGKHHTRFLLSAQPLLCDECHAMNSPTTTAEINALRPQSQTDEPLTIRGTMEIVDDNPNGLVYRINNAKVLSRARTKNSRSTS